MKKFTLLILSLALILRLSAQVTMIVDSIPDYTPPEDHLFIGGDFNGWNPGDSAFMLHKNDQQKWTLTHGAEPEGTLIQFKFTRGSWETVEKGPQGEEISNRVFTFGNGDTLHAIIYNWRDHGGGGTSTAAPNVSVMSENFEMPQLGRQRRIWLYLPPDYETSGLNYPVLYMHDGQNLFDVLTSYAGEWEVDETLNGFAEQEIRVPIVVGIDNGGDVRIDEYSPWHNPQYGGGQGDLYMDFIVQTLKPYIDQNYRTLPGREYTGIMGSSMGGLISHYGGLKYQEVFSKVGIFSPSYWFNDSVYSFTGEEGKQAAMKLYLMCGTLEGGSTVSNMLAMQDTLSSIGFTSEEIFSKVVEGGQHNEALWRQEFGQAYLWLFGSYANKIGEPPETMAIQCFPNPVANILHFNGLMPGSCYSLAIFNMEGARVIFIPNFKQDRLDVSRLSPGVYLVNWSSRGKLFQGKFLKQ